MCNFPTFVVPTMVITLGVYSFTVPSIDPAAWATNLGTFLANVDTYVGCTLGGVWLSGWQWIGSGLLYVINGIVSLIFNAINAVFTTSEDMVGFMGPFAPIFAAIVTGTVGTALVLFGLLGFRALEIAISDAIKVL